MEELPKYDPIKIFLNKIKDRADITSQVLEKIGASMQRCSKACCNFCK